MKNNKIKIEDQSLLLLKKFKQTYEPKNAAIDNIILKGQIELSKGEIPQVVLKNAAKLIHEKTSAQEITIGDEAEKVLSKMDKLSRSNTSVPFGSLFNVF